MSQATLQSIETRVPGAIQRLSTWLPEDFWPLAVEYLVAGQDYLLLLSEDLKIVRSNNAFVNEIASSWDEPVVSFSETLTPGCAKELVCLESHAEKDHETEPFKLKLLHPVRTGVRTVQYTFRHRRGTWVAIGRDQSVETELAGQMSTMIEELATLVANERERSETLKRLSEQDPLTGLANRREFNRIHASYEALLKESGVMFSLVSLDIDHFKDVNDHHGHLFGDEVLKRVARVLEECLRVGDCVARIGGEEFMVIARGAELQAAIELGERIRQAVEKAPMPVPLDRVTISVGIAAASKAGHTGQDELIHLADNALYEAKRRGRNCVCWIE